MVNLETWNFNSAAAKSLCLGQIFGHKINNCDPTDASNPPFSMRAVFSKAREQSLIRGPKARQNAA